MGQDVKVADDAMLIALVRQGGGDAYAELYRRHSGSAAMYAARLVGSQDSARDVVAEAFARILAILRRGRGPAEEFRPYLMRAVRNVAFDRRRRDRLLEFTDEVSVLEGETPFRDLAVEQHELDLVQRAFDGLPDRWKRVLWLTCVEGLSVESAGDALDMSRNSLTSLAYRAREGLRQGYLRACLPPEVGPACATTVDRLPAHVRGALGSTPGRQVELHLLRCAPCRLRLEELQDVNATLREALGSPSRWTPDRVA